MSDPANPDEVNRADIGRYALHAGTPCRLRLVGMGEETGRGSFIIGACPMLSRTICRRRHNS